MRYLLLIILLLALLVSPAAAQSDNEECAGDTTVQGFEIIQDSDIIDEFGAALDTVQDRDLELDDNIAGIMAMWDVRVKWFTEVQPDLPACSDMLTMFETHFSNDLANTSANMAILLLGIMNDAEVEHWTDPLVDTINAERTGWEITWSVLKAIAA